MLAGGNGSADDDADGRWMSYGELAEARRITTPSAIRLVLRHGWRRQKDNHGIMRALVPQKWSEPASSFGAGARLGQAIEALQASVGALRERAEAAERAVQAAERAVQIERGRADRAEQARNAELSRGNYLRDRIDALRADLTEADREIQVARQQASEAMESADALRQADERWRALGRLARIWQAWRG